MRFMFNTSYTPIDEVLERIEKGGHFPIIDTKKTCLYTIRIEKVIYNNPVTVVIWSDGTKTISKCSPEDVYSPETGVALCMLKRFFGNNKIRDLFNDWVPKEFKNTEPTIVNVKDMLKQRKENNN